MKKYNANTLREQVGEIKRFRKFNSEKILNICLVKTQLTNMSTDTEEENTDL